MTRGFVVATSATGAWVINLKVDVIRWGPRDKPPGTLGVVPGTLAAVGDFVVGDFSTALTPTSNSEVAWEATILGDRAILLSVREPLYVRDNDLPLYYGGAETAEIGTPTFVLSPRRVRYDSRRNAVMPMTTARRRLAALACAAAMAGCAPDAQPQFCPSRFAADFRKQSWGFDVPLGRRDGCCSTRSYAGRAAHGCFNLGRAGPRQEWAAREHRCRPGSHPARSKGPERARRSRSLKPAPAASRGGDDVIAPATSPHGCAGRRRHRHRHVRRQHDDRAGKPEDGNCAGARHIGADFAVDLAAVVGLLEPQRPTL